MFSLLIFFCSISYVNKNENMENMKSMKKSEEVLGRIIYVLSLLIKTVKYNYSKSKAASVAQSAMIFLSSSVRTASL